MANLFWKQKNKTKALHATPFKSEEEFEKLVFDSGELLEEIFILKRQIRGGGKAGIPDIIGIDADGNICIIEMKNVPVDASILPQVLQYAFWAEATPDSIKALWLEAENRPDDLTIPWEDREVRIIVVAPEIKRSTLQLVEKINYRTDLIEVKRWVEGPNTFLLVNRLEPEVRPKPRSASGLETYDKHFYETHYNKASAQAFLEYVKEMEALVGKQKWDLQAKFNKAYCGFKAGSRNAFCITWVGSKTFAIFVKLTQEEIAQAGIEITRYEDLWSQGLIYIAPGKTKLATYQKLLERAYRKLTGD